MSGNSLTGNKVKQKFSVAIQSDAYKRLINHTLGDTKRAQRFVASISSAVATNPALQECDAGTIISAALLGESLELSPSPQLGQFYMIPYNNKEKGKIAQFQLGYKGYLQLAQRSGYYKKINVVELKEGELISFNPLEEDIQVSFIDNEVERETSETTGYYAMFEYINGFRKAIYWSREKMEAHAESYSKAFSLQAYHKLKAGEISQKDLWKYSSFWYKDFDAMACKTMLRQLISKWGIMSIELQTAFEKDFSVIHEDGKAEYIDTIEEAAPDVEGSTEQEQETVIEYAQQQETPQQEASPIDDFFSEQSI